MALITGVPLREQCENLRKKINSEAKGAELLAKYVLEAANQDEITVAVDGVRRNAERASLLPPLPPPPVP